jgi:hypothetical protein
LMDDEYFWPILERAEAVGAPIYLHPTPPRTMIGHSTRGTTSGGGRRPRHRSLRLARGDRDSRPSPDLRGCPNDHEAQEGRNPGGERKLSGALPQEASLLPKASYPFLLPASAKLPAEAETVRSPPPTNPSEEAAAYRGSDPDPPEECSKQVEVEGGRTVTIDSLRHENKR